MSEFEQKYREWHTKISYLKSGIRFGAGLAGMVLAWDPYTAILVLSAGLVIAEIFGVLEEIL